jgi:hypothetical protein
LIARISIASLAAIAILIAGCGDDDNGSSLTKDEFVKRADAICAKGTENLGKELSAYLEQQASTAKTESEVAAEAIQAVVLPEVEAQIEKIESLEVPSGDEGEIEAFLEAQRRAVASLEKRKNLSLTTDLDPAFQGSGKLAREYGLESCAYG